MISGFEDAEAHGGRSLFLTSDVRAKSYIRAVTMMSGLEDVEAQGHRLQCQTSDVRAKSYMRQSA